MVIKSLDKALVQTLTLHVFVSFWKTERIFDRVYGYNYSALFIILYMCINVKFQTVFNSFDQVHDLGFSQVSKPGGNAKQTSC